MVGIAEVARTAYPDPTQFDRRSPYHDRRSPKHDPRWSAVDVRFVKKLPRPVLLRELKQAPELAELALVRKGNRLSVMPVSEPQWRFITELARRT